MSRGSYSCFSIWVSTKGIIFMLSRLILQEYLKLYSWKGPCFLELTEKIWQLRVSRWYESRGEGRGLAFTVGVEMEISWWKNQFSRTRRFCFAPVPSEELSETTSMTLPRAPKEGLSQVRRSFSFLNPLLTTRCLSRHKTLQNPSCLRRVELLMSLLMQVDRRVGLWSCYDFEI